MRGHIRMQTEYTYKINEQIHTRHLERAFTAYQHFVHYSTIMAGYTSIISAASTHTKRHNKGCKYIVKCRHWIRTLFATISKCYISNAQWLTSAKSHVLPILMIQFGRAILIFISWTSRQKKNFFFFLLCHIVALIKTLVRGRTRARVLSIFSIKTLRRDIHPGGRAWWWASPTCKLWKSTSTYSEFRVNTNQRDLGNM